jgi:peptidoglycan/LPS O-acetylase OafA/YrhL
MKFALQRRIHECLREIAAGAENGSGLRKRPPQVSIPVPIVFRGQISQLDGLRAVAIFLVLCHHFWPTSGFLTPFADIAHAGWIGVDLFFVISGFLICGILLDTRERPAYFRNFYARRSLRIFPLYYSFLAAVAIAIPIIQRSQEFFNQSGSIWWYILYGGNIREAITGHEPAYVLAPLWSLSIEEQFYISFPLIVWLLGPQRLWKFLWLLVIAAPVFRLVTFFLWPLNERIQYLATFSRMDNIAIGCLIATAFRLDKINVSIITARRIAFSAFLVLATAFTLGGLNRMRPFCRIAGYSMTAFSFAAVLIWAVVARPRWLQLLPLTSLGKICYGVYLLQRPSQIVLGKLLLRMNIHLDSTTLFFAYIAFSILIATISWNVFERHVLKLKDRFVLARKPAAKNRSSAAASQPG